MSLFQTLQDDMKNALKAGEKEKLSTLRLLKSSVSYAQIEKGSELTDEEVLQVLSREAKKRREAAEAAVNAGRPEMAAKEQEEFDFISSYLPAQLSEPEIEEIVKEIILQVGAKDLKDRGKVMGPLMQKVKGKADGKVVSSIVEKLLQA